MIFGHNTNVTLGTVKYHVQTEDAGVNSALIDTTVYCGGRVLHRRTNSYLDLLPLNPDREEALKLRLDEQHRQVLEEIRSGALYFPPPTAAQSRPPSPFSDSALSAAPNAAPSSASAPATLTAATASTSEKIPAAPPVEPLSLELTNAKSWLAGKRATLQLRITNRNGQPVKDASVTVSIAGAVEPANFYTETDDRGEAHLDFDMPRLGDTSCALVIEASHGNAKGAMRFALRARQRIPVN
jgi:hypothetical protein